ncbi:unnamed protein product [Lymnaea stagnalis]|uniref:Uncharacterized protein n=1 Tax=Lymnaea stagnalis TaxID=6523 RepID=A0AAV2HEE5_LYMST
MAFQKLPRHMRRRAMSHNIKRVPKRLHTVVRAEIEKTKAPGKCPSRRHRRRPSNLLSEYEQRKRRIGWLETHIWHAKRFKMVEKWGYRLALHPNDKSNRACYRAVTNNCLIQARLDVSFEQYLEISGPREQIIAGLSHLTCEKTGLTFAARMTSLGTRQGTLTIYTYDSYPYGAIGPVTYLWKASSSSIDASCPSTIWICSHVAYYSQILNEVNKCFNPNSLLCQDDSVVKTMNGHVTKNPDVVITSLKDSLVKLRLHGPAANLVLAETLKPSKLTNPVPPAWWRNYYSCEDHLHALLQQTSLWDKLMKCHSAGEAPPDCVFGLTVGDPRLLLPPKRSKVSVKPGEGCLPSDVFTEQVASSPIWDSEIRLNVKTSKISEQKLNDLKSRHIVPGSPLDLGEKESAIPILLIQRAGPSPNNTPSSPLSYPSVRSDFGSGWDLVIPSGWAMAFWVALVYRGARVGGLREALSISLQSGMLHAPVDYPDSASGEQELKLQTEQLRFKYNRRPPAKRPNYTKFGNPSPFCFEYDKLIRDWAASLHNSVPKEKETESLTQDVNHFFVLREKNILRLLNLALTDTQRFLQTNKKKGHICKGSEANSEKAFEAVLLSVFGEDQLNFCLSAIVPVHLTLLHRGVPASYGHISIPSSSDLNELSQNKTFGGPLESKHKDPFKAKRKEEKKERLNLKIQEQDLKYNHLNHTSRPIIGFVSNGDFDLGQGQGSGQGFCSVMALLELLKSQKHRRCNLVLVRNPSSLQFRFASLSIIL